MPDILGLDALERNMQALAREVDSDDFVNALQGIGGTLRDQLKAASPIGPTGRMRKKGLFVAGMKVGEESIEKSGSLKRSWKSKKFKRKTQGSPAVFVAVDRKQAPHAHLVEFGHGGPHPAPAHPFVRPTVDKFKSEYPRLVTAALREKLGATITPTTEMIASSM